MFGFFIGTACLIGLAVSIGRGHRHGHGHGHGHGYGGFGGCGPGGGRFRHHGGPFGGFARRGLYRVFERLETTPGQEKAILAALEELKEHAKDARSDVRGTARDAAEAFRSEDFDTNAFAGLFDAHFTRAEGMRDEVAKALSKIHEVLAPEQRERLADMLESRLRFMRGF
jgi:Spy/CpxP family protein refolding chaperone